MTQFPNDDIGTKDLVSRRDIILESDSDQDGVGDIVFRTGGVERARVTAAGVGSGFGALTGGSLPASLDGWLVFMTEGGCFEMTSITRDSNEGISSATVKWYDGSAGTFTTTATDASTGAINSYTVTHTTSGKTVTQAAMTRDTNGAVTTKPALTVA